QDITDLDARAKAVQAFTRQKGVRAHVNQKSSGDDSLHRFHRELSTYGSHANPMTVAARLSSATPGQANLGHLSAGYTERPRLCASHILHTVGYVVSGLRESFGTYLTGK